MSPQSVYGWLRRHALFVDAGLTGVLLVVLVAPLWIGTRSATPSETAATAVAVATLSTVMVLALVVRRRHPVLAFTVVSLCCALQLFVRSDPVAADLAFVVATYSLAANATSRLTHLVGLGTVAVAAVACGLAASVLPARRATRIAPAAALADD